MTEDNSTATATTDRVNLVLGTTMMVIGSSMAIAIFADRTGSSLSFLPAVWGSTRDFHIFICLMIFGFAAILLKMPVGQGSVVDPKDRLFHSVKFFTRRNCELCEHALAALQAFTDILGEIEVIDIDESPDDHRRFCNCIPVLEIDGKVRFRGAIKPALLNRLIEGARQQRQQSPTNLDPVTPHGAYDIQPGDDRS